MVDMDLTISDRLSALLPPLTDEERKQLEENLIRDGRVLDPILYWFDGKENVVLDGMNRLPIAKEHGIPYRTEPVDLGTKDYCQAELWILDHQLGRRNLLDPHALRQVRGDFYNRLKGGQGGDHKSEKSKSQNETLIGGAAEQVAEKAGVSRATVMRDGARMEALDKCVESFQKGVRSAAIKATDAQIKAVAKLKPDKQEVIAREVRFGKSLTQAMEKHGPKPTAKEAKAEPEEVSQAENDRYTLGQWLATIDALLSKTPTIDELRGRNPGTHGDKFVKCISEARGHLANWKRGIK